MFAIFIESCRANHMQLAARQRRLEDIGCIHRTFRGASANQQVQFINKKNDVTLFFDFSNYLFQPILEFTAIFSTGDHRRHIQHNHAAI